MIASVAPKRTGSAINMGKECLSCTIIKLSVELRDRRERQKSLAFIWHLGTACYKDARSASEKGQGGVDWRK
jgi:hypothetical protein